LFSGFYRRLGINLMRNLGKSSVWNHLVFVMIFSVWNDFVFLFYDFSVWNDFILIDDS